MAKVKPYPQTIAVLREGSGDEETLLTGEKPEDHVALGEVVLVGVYKLVREVYVSKEIKVKLRVRRKRGAR